MRDLLEELATPYFAIADFVLAAPMTALAAAVASASVAIALFVVS